MKGRLPAAAMVVVGLIGCLIPITRALRIQPTEALPRSRTLTGTRA
jgi:hypothetical protein